MPEGELLSFCIQDDWEESWEVLGSPRKWQMASQEATGRSYKSYKKFEKNYQVQNRRQILSKGEEGKIPGDPGIPRISWKFMIF